VWRRDVTSLVVVVPRAGPRWPTDVPCPNIVVRQGRKKLVGDARQKPSPNDARNYILQGIQNANGATGGAPLILVGANAKATSIACRAWHWTKHDAVSVDRTICSTSGQAHEETGRNYRSAVPLQPVTHHPS